MPITSKPLWTVQLDGEKTSWTFHAGTTTLPSGDVFLDLPPWSKGFVSMIVGDAAPDDKVPLTLTKCPGYVALLRMRQDAVCPSTEGTDVTQEESFFGVTAPTPSKKGAKNAVVDAYDDDPQEMSFTVPAEGDFPEFTIRCLSPRGRLSRFSTLTIILDYETIDFVVRYIRDKGLSELAPARKWSKKADEDKMQNVYWTYGYNEKHPKKRGRPTSSTKPPTSPRSDNDDDDAPAFD